MKIEYHKNFIKSYNKRIKGNKKLEDKVRTRLSIFIDNPKDDSLRLHPLKGEMDKYWSFSVTGDIRVIFEIIDDVIFLHNIGTHNQVY